MTELVGALALLAVVGLVVIANPIGRSRALEVASEVVTISVVAELAALGLFVAAAAVWFGYFGGAL